jgi:flagellar hook protein FlgE
LTFNSVTSRFGILAEGTVFMALTSTLFTGLSGLAVNQTRLNVVGNNIANVNTVAFKGSRVLFKPQFYVTDAAGSAPNGDFGGTNPSQRGLGADVAAIEKNFTPGAIEPTGRATDLAIEGDGFFIVQSAQQKYTRDGSFTLNAANQLTTSGGELVQGFGVDGNGNVVAGRLQNIEIPLGAMTNARATENAIFEGNLNASGAVASGASILMTQPLTVVGGGIAPDAGTPLTALASVVDPSIPLIADGQVFTLQGTKGGRDLAPATFAVEAGSTVGQLLEFFRGALGIDTGVPDDGNALTPTAGTAVEVDPADPTAARLVLTGNLGSAHALALTGSAFTTSTGSAPFIFADGQNAAGIVSNPAGESVHTSLVAYDSLGTPLVVNLTMVFESTADTGNVWRFFAQSADDTDVDLVLGNGTLTFDNEGRLIGSTGTTIAIDRSDTGARTPLTIRMNFDTMTSLTSRTSELVMTRQDGSSTGTLNSFSIGADGIVTGLFTNGLTQTLGMVALATFKNPQGLMDSGGNMYVAGASSGTAVITSPLAMGAGSVRSGALEMSNVDLSEEFINLIISTTGFSAASRVISTSDQLMRELLNTSR